MVKPNVTGSPSFEEMALAAERVRAASPFCDPPEVSEALAIALDGLIWYTAEEPPCIHSDIQSDCLSCIRGHMWKAAYAALQKVGVW